MNLLKTTDMISQEFIARLHELTIELAKLDCQLKRIESKSKSGTRIPCPIQMEDYMNKLCIPFNNYRQSLYYSEGVYISGGRVDKNRLVDCDLIPCERKEISAGDLAYRTDLTSPDFNDLRKYCVILDRRHHAYITRNYGVDRSSEDYKHWYKVVRREP